MRLVKLKIHRYAAISSELAFPGDDLCAIFEAVGIRIEWKHGEKFSLDPGTVPGFATLVSRFRAENQEWGHLILAGQYPLYDDGVAGELLDIDNRGVCAVYTESAYITRWGKAGLLQTCVHEIGHLLNLDHHDIALTYASAMDQAGRRPTVPDEILGSWDKADAEAATVVQQGKTSYHTRPVTLPRCPPFAHAASERLNTLSTGQLLPWGGKFEGTYRVEWA